MFLPQTAHVVMAIAWRGRMRPARLLYGKGSRAYGIPVDSRKKVPRDPQDTAIRVSERFTVLLALLIDECGRCV